VLVPAANCQQVLVVLVQQLDFLAVLGMLHGCRMHSVGFESPPLLPGRFQLLQLYMAVEHHWDVYLGTQVQTAAAAAGWLVV
jgi:hypothetical protein